MTPKGLILRLNVANDRCDNEGREKFVLHGEHETGFYYAYNGEMYVVMHSPEGWSKRHLGYVEDADDVAARKKEWAEDKSPGSIMAQDLAGVGLAIADSYGIEECWESD